jgi:hypothetical protein
MWYRKIGRATVLAVGSGALLLSSQAGIGQGNGDDEEEEELEFEEAQLYFELNHTDGDLGFHGLIDGDGWKSLKIEAPDESLLMNIWIRNALRRQGMTEIFFESEEPSFDELSPAQFFKRFPAGIYEIEAVTLDDEEMEGEVRVSHVMPGPAGGVKVNGQNSAPNCDAEDLPVVSEPVTLDWNAVTKSHPTVGRPNVDVSVLSYEVVGEIEREGKNPETLVFSALLPRNVTKFEFPESFTSLAEDEMKFEIVTKLWNGNQTAVESCFEIE